MRVLLAICMIVASTVSWAADKPAAAVAPAAPVVTGKVLEVKDVDTYTYIRLKTKQGEVWAAVMKAPIKKGATVTIEDVSEMHDFESKTLKKTFPVILFGSLSGAVSGAPAGHGMGQAPAAAAVVKMEDIHVAKASGANAYTVAEIVSKAAELKDKPVVLSGKVVKYNPGIMGKNWVHLRDGTGTDADGSNDILVTTSSGTKVGYVVTAKGIVHTEKDFGSGYAYKVLIEEATLQ